MASSPKGAPAPSSDVKTASANQTKKKATTGDTCVTVLILLVCYAALFWALGGTETRESKLS